MEFVNYKINDIAISIKTGKTPSTKEKLYFEGDIPWITTSDLKGQKILNFTEKTISELALVENEAFTFKENTIIISTIGEIGKACIIKKPMACNQQLSGIEIDENFIYPDLFYYWVVKNQGLLNFKANKSIISILNNKVFKNIAITFPKQKDVQRDLIAQLDQIQNLIDIKVRIIKILDDLTKSTFLKMFGDAVNNTKKFPLKKLKDLTKKGKIITYGIVQAGPNIENGVRYLRSGDIKNGVINADNLLRTSHEIANKFERTKCSFGDIIMTIRATIGDVALIDEDLDGVNLSRGTAIISPNEKIVNKYVLFQLLSSEGFKFLLNKDIKGSTFKEISLSKLREIKIPISKDLKLQEQFEKFYLDLNSQKNKIQKSLLILEQLFQSILHKSFNEDVEIKEELIFDELIKSLVLNDLKGNKDRLQYLINLFSENKLNDVDSYNNARNKLFELLDENVIIQSFDGEKTNISVK